MKSVKDAIGKCKGDDDSGTCHLAGKTRSYMVVARDLNGRYVDACTMSLTNAAMIATEFTRRGYTIVSMQER